MCKKMAMNLREEDNVFILNAGGKTFKERSLDRVLAIFAADYKTSQKKVQKAFGRFNIDDVVVILPPKTELIYSASGKREGFPASLIGTECRIVAFDSFTKSLNTVCVETPCGKRSWGSHRELDAVNGQQNGKR